MSRTPGIAACILLLVVSPVPGASQAAAPRRLGIVIVEGEGAINNIRQRTAREPIVEVQDENNRPVAGATVVFLLPGSGPGGAFPDGARSLTVITGRDGRAAARGFRHNGEAGRFEIQVNVSYQELAATATIRQANAVLTAAGGGVSGKLIAILAIAGGAAAAGIAVAATGGGNGNGGVTPPPGTPPATVTPGVPSVGGP